MTFFQWTLLFIGVVLFLWMRMRKGARRNDIIERQISISGTRVSTVLTKETPLACLMDDDIVFGESFKDKTLPELPHADGCACQTEDYIARSREWFTESAKEQVWKSDLGDLNKNEARYYKYALIQLFQPDEEERQKFEEVQQTIKVKEAFKEKVQSHLANKEL